MARRRDSYGDGGWDDDRWEDDRWEDDSRRADTGRRSGYDRYDTGRRDGGGRRYDTDRRDDYDRYDTGRRDRGERRYDTDRRYNDDGWDGDDPWDNPEPKKKSGLGTFLLTLLLVVAIGVFAFSGYKLVGYYLAYKAGSDEYSKLNDDFMDTGKTTEKTTEKTPETTAPEVLKDVTQLENPETLSKIVEKAPHETTTENQETKSLPTLVNPVDFTQLQAINPEVIGWIRVGAINVSYPVARAEDNDFYLHRTFRKVDNFAGCIFENCDNSPYFTDQNTIIYGHNMKNGTMFGQLRKFAEQETLDKNPYFWMFTPNFIYQYRIFSSSIVGTTGDPYNTRFSQADFQKFINDSIARSEVNCGNVTVTTSDRLMTLSTCTGDSSTRRILQGVLEQVYIAK